MKKLFTLLFLLTLTITFSQNNEGNRAGTIFYPTIDRNEKTYNISVDLFELGSARYVEAELYDDNEVRLGTKLFKISIRGKKYYISLQVEGEGDNGPEKEVSLYDINFQLKNPDPELGYMKVKIKILNRDYQVTDFSQEIFY